MVLFLFFVWFLLEIVGYLVIGCYWLNFDWFYVVFGVIGGQFGLRVGMVVVIWLFVMVYVLLVLSFDFVIKIWLMLGEYFVFLFIFLLVIFFEWLWMLVDWLLVGKFLILFVYGYGCSCGVWWLFWWCFEIVGYSVVIFSLVLFYISIGKLVL